MKWAYATLFGTIPLYVGTRVNGFPHHVVPDGTLLAPHHFYTGVLLAGLLAWWASGGETDTRSFGAMAREKAGFTLGALAVSAFAWFTLWGGPSPFLGAVGTLAGLAGALVAVVAAPFWSRWRWTRDVTMPTGGLRAIPARLVVRVWSVLTVRSLTALGVLIALDDAVEHAFGIWTPLDWFWGAFLHRWLTEAVRWIGAVV
jgi:hypothetical protein